MTFEGAIQNRAWLVANDKEAEFEFWCGQNHCDQTPEALQFFHNEVSKTTGEEKNDAFIFLNCCGFFVAWPSAAGICKVFVPGEAEGKKLLKLLPVKAKLFNSAGEEIKNF